MNSTKKVFEETLKYRSMMNLSLSSEKAKYIWGKKFLKSLSKKESNMLEDFSNSISEKKIDICKNNISKLLIFNWVKFIGISGSVGAGFAKEEDDIDIFIVVKNNRMWIYRGMLAISNLFHNKIRAKRHKVVTDKLCINLIAEERGLLFENDMFNFHELVFLIPVYNSKYLRYIFSNNEWLRKEFFVKKENFHSRVYTDRKRNLFFRFLNSISFFVQTLFMTIAGHGPDIPRLKRNNELGKIEFFEEDYKKNILERYYNEFKSTN